MLLVRHVTTGLTPAQAFSYLADFTTTTEWDPGTERTTRVSGDGGLGSRYRNVSRFAGRTVELVYEVVAFEPGRRITLQGENSGVRATDTITVQQVAGGVTEVTYQADFRFRGAAAVVAPLFGPALRRLADRAQQGMAEALLRQVEATGGG
jgi:Polyketide cyclase / dehydrase and lipid transport